MISIHVPGSPGATLGPTGAFAPTSLRIGDASVSSLRVADLRVRPAGAVVALVGDPISDGCTSYCQDHGVVVQLQSGGAALDPAFGNGGIVELPMAFAGGNGILVGDENTSVNLTVFSLALGAELVLQPDGKVLVLGTCEEDVITGDRYYACIERLNVDGSVDDAFGLHGVAVVYEPVFPNSSGVALALDANGRILVLMACSSSGDYAGVSRLGADGSVDETFAYDEDFTYGLARLPNTGIPRALALQSSGRILALTGSPPSANGAEMMVSALDGTTGATDHTFGGMGSGAFTFDFFDTFATVSATTYPADGPMSLLVSAGDAIFVLGTAGVSDSSTPLIDWKRSVGLAKATPDGELDPTFGGGGLVRITAIEGDDYSLDTWSFLPFGSDLFVAASATPWDATTPAPAIPLLLKLHTDGSLDESYAQGGVLRLPFTLPLLDPGAEPIPSSARYALAAGDGTVYVGAETFVDGGADGIVIAEPPQ